MNFEVLQQYIWAILIGAIALVCAVGITFAICSWFESRKRKVEVNKANLQMVSKAMSYYLPQMSGLIGELKVEKILPEPLPDYYKWMDPEDLKEYQGDKEWRSQLEQKIRTGLL